MELRKINGKLYKFSGNRWRICFKKLCPSCNKTFYPCTFGTITCGDRCRALFKKKQGAIKPHYTTATKDNNSVEVFNKSKTGSFLIDNDDLNSIKRFNWTFDKDKYVVRQFTNDDLRLNIKLHRYIMGAGEGEMIDHINRDPSDNRRCNLRFTNKSLNGLNQYGENTGIKKTDNGYRLNINKKLIGYFKTKTEAIRAKKDIVDIKHRKFNEEKKNS